MIKTKKSKTTATPKTIINPSPKVSSSKRKKSSKKIVKKIIVKKPIIDLPPQPPEPVEIKTEPIKKTETQNMPDLISFYGHSIRSVYTKNQWYFCLEDILKVANIIDPTKFLINLKNQTDLKDNYYQFVESFSYQENDNPIIIPIVNYQSFIQLLPYVRQIGSTIPGPFPDWLKNMANRSF